MKHQHNNSLVATSESSLSSLLVIHKKSSKRSRNHESKGSYRKNWHTILSEGLDRLSSWHNISIARFKITNRLGPTQRWSINTIIHTGGNTECRLIFFFTIIAMNTAGSMNREEPRGRTTTQFYWKVLIEYPSSWHYVLNARFGTTNRLEPTQRGSINSKIHTAGTIVVISSSLFKWLQRA
jgi:hypothetical protein